MTRSLKFALAAAFLAIAPDALYAQTASNGPLTRAAVRQEAAELLALGYCPNDWLHYPESATVFELRHAARQTTLSNAHPAQS